MGASDKLVELIERFCSRLSVSDITPPYGYENLADFLISNGVTVQEWIPAIEPPKENGYYLCVVLFSAVGNRKEYRRKILFWEDNIWIEKPNSFRIEKPLYWSQMLEMPQPLKGE